MEEQEILSIMREHVARQEAAARDGSPSHLPAPLPVIDSAAIERLPGRVRDASRLAGQLNPRNSGVLNRAIQAFKRLIQRSIGWHTRSFQPFHDTVADAFETQGKAINLLHQHLLDLQPLKAQVLQLKKDQQMAAALDQALKTAESATQEQQSPYVELYRGLSPVLDVGCGRGEFLQLLKRSGIEAYGVDSDHTVCEIVRRKLLNVVEADLFQHLRRLPERSLGGVFCARVMEYLPPNLQLELVTLCSTRLMPGGVLVIETINPDSDAPFGRNWQVDPSHLRPIYAELLRSMLDSNGFHDARVAILAPRVASLATAGDPSSYSGNGDAGTDSASASSLMAGAPAYAVIAHCS